MGKKCIPGVMCFENVTILLLIVIGSMVFYLYYIHLTKNMAKVAPASSTAMYPAVQLPPAIMTPPTPAPALSYDGNPSPDHPRTPTLLRHSGLLPIVSTDPRIDLSNPYAPPLKVDNALFGGFPSISTPVVPPRSGLVAINIPTSTANTAYSQTGILTKQGNSGEQMILPLMGRNLLNGRDKWQYYTMTNGAGSINTKLPISVNGKSCTGEYGCDSISSGDIVYVEGYNDTFRATVYENALMQYLPL
jgi:hypothetical protein